MPFGPNASPRGESSPRAVTDTLQSDFAESETAGTTAATVAIATTIKNLHCLIASLRD